MTDEGFMQRRIGMDEHDTWQQMRKHLRAMADTIDGAVRKVSPFGGSKTRPLVDICETEREIVIYAEVPGVPREGLRVTMKRGVLTISGKEKRADCTACPYLTQERGAAEFSRDIALPDSADMEAEPAASLADGLLTVRVAKGPSETARTITVNVQ
jgi:HSP20 family protein